MLHHCCYSLDGQGSSRVKNNISTRCFARYRCQFCRCLQEKVHFIDDFSLFGTISTHILIGGTAIGTALFRRGRKRGFFGGSLFGQIVFENVVLVVGEQDSGQWERHHQADDASDVAPNGEGKQHHGRR